MSTLLLAACAILFVDQWSKIVVGARVGHRALVFGSIRIRYVEAHKSIYDSGIGRSLLALAWLAALASTFVLRKSGEWFQSELSTAYLGMAFGGAASNLIDVVRRGRIVDFIDLGWWPVFNIADIAIVGGLVMAFLLRL